MLHDFPAGGAPDTFMRADVLERRVERADTMWLAGDERVHRDRHDARHGFALAIQRVELALQHRLEFGHRHLHLENRRERHWSAPNTVVTPAAAYRSRT